MFLSLDKLLENFINILEYIIIALVLRPTCGSDPLKFPYVEENKINNVLSQNLMSFTLHILSVNLYLISTGADDFDDSQRTEKSLSM